MIDRQRLADLRAAEDQLFLDLHPRSAELAAQARGPLLAGVPMPWMTRWPGAFPVFAASATGRGWSTSTGSSTSTSASATPAP